MFSRDNRGDDLFSNSTIDTSNPDKIIIREKEAPRKKVRRRVKKGTKDASLAKRDEIKKASKVKVVSKKTKTDKKSVYDTVSFDVMDLDNELSKAEKTSPKKESGYKIPRLSEINKKDDFDNNDLGSDFRQSSADWKDAVIPDYSGLDDLSGGSFFDGLKNASWMQWLAFGLAVVLFVSSILTTNVYAKLQCADNRAEAFSKLSVYEDNSFEQVAASVESVEAPISLEEAKPQLGKVLSLVLSSVEKDLKIKLIDEDETLVKDIPWSVTVADNDGNSSEEVDDDQDGIIHMTDVNAGDYTVTLNPNDSLSDFELPTSAQMVSVKAKVEYKVIANIKDEIKSEKEINAAAEDAAGNQAAEAEAAPPATTDTVEFVESTKTVNGEEYVEATPDISKTAKIDKGGKLLAVIERVKANAKANFGKASVAYMRLVAENDTTSSSSDTTTSSSSDTTTSSSSDTTTSSSSDTTTSGSSDTTTSSSSESSSSTATSSSSTTTTQTESSTTQQTVVTFNKTSLSMRVGETTALTATVTPSASITFNSSDSGIASIDSSGNVKAIKVGTARLYATANGKAATCDVTVTAAEPKYDENAQLYDASKNALYVKEGDSYRLAKYKDYLKDKSQKFYRKQETFLYTGWQTIDGVKCYFDKDHNRVTGKQIIGGVEYDFGESGSVSTGSGSLGIDVSKYQPSINWSAVKSSGVDYVIIRCGYRGSSTGVLVEDPYFKSHIKGAKAAGLKVGVYFFTTAMTEAEAVEEASMCAYLCNGYGLDFPIFMDCESSPRAGYNGMSAGQRTAIIKAFCNTIKSAGYSAGVYANKTWFSSYINTGELSGYKIWLAQYNSAGPTYSGRYDMWQYTSKGSVNGISGYVDMNRCYYR